MDPFSGGWVNSKNKTKKPKKKKTKLDGKKIGKKKRY